MERAADSDLHFLLLGRAENRLVEEKVAERNWPELAFVHRPNLRRDHIYSDLDVAAALLNSRSTEISAFNADLKPKMVTTIGFHAPISTRSV